MPSSSRPTADVPGRGGGRPAPARRRSKYGLAPYGFLLPGLVVYALFLLYPLGRAVQISLYDWDGLTLGTFVGLANYADVLTDDTLRAAFAHALVLIFFFAVLPLAIGLVLAAVLTRGRVRGLGFFRTIVFLPQVIAMVVVAVAWRQIYAPTGLLNDVLRAVGLDSWTRTWLGDFTLTLPAVGLIGTWVSTGLVTVLLMAGMSRVPGELYEAATLDGAGAVRQFLAITMPSVRAEIVVALTLTIIAALKTFDLVYVTTSGGPGNTTTVPSFEVYRRAFQLGEVGSAAAVAVVLTVLIFAINLLVNRIGERER
ncbi:carbohydrate ABC transporter permease [Georgenia yuyongxinii]|uniref:Sugar ABC transporter permease n=1 Tax=Georgenia yuyongxinii TaxID=2589797 RepID=A0A552WUB4_9MICO|nr:sugar ABC transporter permease [Georgenia yuyongxinii]TRW46275.1 sugar ABC transporter permease [Georgenia yuyongxinii]